jgi:hypothetical protein
MAKIAYMQQTLSRKVQEGRTRINIEHAACRILTNILPV